MNLSIEKTEISLGGKKILKDISLQIQSNEFIGIIGPNGSGKSTLLRCIYKVLKPEQGNIFLGDKNLIDYSQKEIAKVLAAVLQEMPPEFDFKVHEVVLMGRSPHKRFLEADGMKDYQMVEDALYKVGMQKYTSRDFFTLSGGEKQRVLLARALCQEPKIMVLDEPTNHLDIQYQLSMLSLLRGLDIPVIAALHDLNLAASYCDYLYILKEGEIVANGKPEEVLTSSIIKETYQVIAEVSKHPRSGKPLVYYIDAKDS